MYDRSKTRLDLQAHSNSDVDQNQSALHHTLGEGPNQAAPGTVTFGLVPIGGIIMFAGADGTHPHAGTKWLNCSGQAISRTTYAELFALIGTTYGAGDGSTTFNIPSIGDRFPVGESGTKALGSTGGSATHTHPLSDSAWAQIAMFAANITARRINIAAGWVESFRSGHTDIAESGASTTVGTPLDGDTDSASSLPPYIALNYLIRVK